MHYLSMYLSELNEKAKLMSLWLLDELEKSSFYQNFVRDVNGYVERKKIMLNENLDLEFLSADNKV
jgi:hypothetical protein